MNYQLKNTMSSVTTILANLESEEIINSLLKRIDENLSKGVLKTKLSNNEEPYLDKVLFLLKQQGFDSYSYKSVNEFSTTKIYGNSIITIEV